MNGLPLPLPRQDITSLKLIRVEFQGSIANGPMKIERRFPTELQTYMTVTTWTDFCNQVDQAHRGVRSSIDTQLTMICNDFSWRYPSLIIRYRPESQKHADDGYSTTIRVPAYVQILMLSPNSIGVQIHGSMNQDIKIERRFPDALQSYLSATSWTDFCDQVDQALNRFNKAQRISKTLCFLLFLIPGIVMILYCYLSRVGSSINTQIIKICNDFSSRYPSLNIHFRHYFTHRELQDYSYIEIEIPNPSSSTETSVSYNLDHPITIATPAFSEKDSMTVKSVAERLADLESIRSIITEQEYSNKLQEILSEV